MTVMEASMAHLQHISRSFSSIFSHALILSKMWSDESQIMFSVELASCSLQACMTCLATAFK